MKLRIHYLIGTGLLVAALSVLPAVAEGSSSGTSANSGSEDTTQSTAQTPETDLEKEATAEVTTTTLAQRLAKHEDETKVKLSTADQLHLKTRCLPAQATIKNLGNKVNANVPQRVNAYIELSSHLTSIAAKLKAQGLDTTELEAENTILAGKIATFKADLIIYKQDLSDLQAVDCTKDPTAFKAALEAARTLREKIGGEITDISTYVTKTIKPTLATLRAQLEAKEGAGGSH